MSKHDYAVRTAACLAYLMLQQQDSVGLVTFDTTVRRYIPPRGRPRHLRAIINELKKQKPGHETELGAVFHEMVAKIQRRGLLIILSDLFGDVDQLMKSLAHFRHANHEIIIFQIWDPDELDFPFRQWTQFESLEASANRHLVDPAQIRRAYLAATGRVSRTAGQRLQSASYQPGAHDDRSAVRRIPGLVPGVAQEVTMKGGGIS